MIRNRYSTISIMLLIASALLFSFCGGGGGGGSSSGEGTNSPGVVSISINPSDPSLLIGKTLKMTAMGTYPDLSTEDISDSPSLTWQSSNPAVASCSGRNLNGIAEGTTTINASMNGVTASVTVTVESMFNKPMIYVATQSPTNTDYFSQYDITVESNAQTVIRFIPDANYADVVASNTSWSFAESQIYPYTVDNRLFTKDDSRPMEWSGSVHFMEKDPQSNSDIEGWGTAEPQNTNNGGFTIMGRNYYYVESRTWDAFGTYGGDFKVFNIDQPGLGHGTTLIPYGDVEVAHSALQASKGTLYDGWTIYYTAAPEIHYVQLLKRDPTTGRIIPGSAKDFVIANTVGITRLKIGFDGDNAYWAIFRESNRQIQLWTANFSDSVSTMIFEGPFPGIDSGLYFDVNNGYIIMANWSGTIILYNVSTGQSTTYDVGMNIYWAEVLCLIE